MSSWGRSNKPLRRSLAATRSAWTPTALFAALADSGAP
jgi:hypothetical protein